MSDTSQLENMLTTPARCELGYSLLCEGLAWDHGAHPTMVALGQENEAAHVWYCSPCAVQAARDS